MDLDPLARETVPNPFGGRNSVLNLLPVYRSHLIWPEQKN